MVEINTEFKIITMHYSMYITGAMWLALFGLVVYQQIKASGFPRK